MCIMENREVSPNFKPPKLTGLRDFPKGCGLNAAKTDTTSEGVVQHSYKASESTGHIYWKRRKCAVRSIPLKGNHIKRLKLEPYSDEASGGKYDSNVVSQEDFDILGKKKVESNEEYGVQYNVVSGRDFDQRGKRKIGSNENVTLEKVKKALGLFRSVCSSLEEEKGKTDGIKCTRIDFRAAKILKDSLKHIRINEPIIGSIPGIEVNDKFLYRAELGIVGIHRPGQSGIDYLNRNGTLLATSVVASGGYANDIGDSDTLVYVGQGGRVTPKNKVPEDQVLEKGNLALKNSMKAGNPIRVLHKVEIMNSLTRKDSEMYTYDGLYIVVEYWHEFGHFDKRVYKFRLARLPGQPKLVARKKVLL